ncbi:cytochrome P450 [Streptomyces sp. NBC_00199]|uniref:cytochrome P450 n=1 Tax=Streptomyces sp. NBC_00199 TaxID=2975678 RepID=UPI002258C33B|nr:cytochrome P450 [Streptomyces sp. NBC_00199]MCX5265603.1 cytochrome P450 [Streptomyces sp. NBC_00199]
MVDSTLALLMQGYAWLPDRRRRSRGNPVRARLMGKNAVALHGPEAVRFFYDESHIERHGALPGPLLDTLFGRGAVHTLDGQAHRVRKALFMSLLKDRGGLASLAEHLEAQWSLARQRWAGRDRVVLFDESSLLLTRAVCDWAGVPLGNGAEETARDLVAMVDGFASAGPRHLRARRSRSRQEARIAQLVEAIRNGTQEAPASSVLAAAVAHRDADGQPLDPHTAAVEILNVIRPTVAVTWFLTFAAHALHRWPEHRKLLADGDAAYARAFAHEIRRFYPFAPFIGGLAAADLRWDGYDIPAGSMVLLDLYGQNHDPQLWPDPYTFNPGRFLGHEPDPDELVPQGGSAPATNHRCPGEDVTLTVLETLVPRLAALHYDVPAQELGIPLRRIPTAPRSGFIMTNMR